jgi:hypothetical protein
VDECMHACETNQTTFQYYGPSDIQTYVYIRETDRLYVYGCMHQPCDSFMHADAIDRYFSFACFFFSFRGTASDVVDVLLVLVTDRERRRT